MFVVPTLHPAFLLRNSEADQGSTARFENVVIEDLKKAVRLLRSQPTWDESAIWEKDGAGRHKNLFPTPEEVISFCDEALKTIKQRRARGDKRAILTMDVETTGEGTPLQAILMCVGMAYRDLAGKKRVLCVPNLSRGGKSYWGAHDGARVFAAVKALLEDPEVSKCMHNGAFDSCVMRAVGVDVKGWDEDTMQAHHVLDAEMPQGLGFVASRRLDVRYWKDDVKGKGGWLNLQDVDLRSYNCRDNLITLELCEELVTELETKHPGQYQLYREEMELCRIMLRATVRGLLIDKHRRDDPTYQYVNKKGAIVTAKGLRVKLDEKIDDALARLRAVAGSPSFDPNKPDHLRYLLFKQLGFPVVKETKTGLPSTDKNAMVLLAILAETAAQKNTLSALVDFRQAFKMKSTYVVGLPILADDRLHPMWKNLPVTGRFSSSPNAQNWNAAVKHLFRAVPGRKLVGVDLSQAELRLMAYYANDTSLIEMYRQGVNVHTANAALIFKVKPPTGHKDLDPVTAAYLTQEVPKLLKGLDFNLFPNMPEKNWKDTRTLAKNGVFGGNYGAIAETLLEVLRAKRDPDTGHQLFPNLKLDEVEAFLILWFNLHPAIPQWWQKTEYETPRRGYYECPISGRRQWYRAGFKRNEMLNRPIQSGVASWVNKNMIEIQHQFDKETGGDCLIVLQVHDAITADAEEGYAQRAGQIMLDYLNRPFPLPGHPAATLPAEKYDIGDYLDET